MRALPQVLIVGHGQMGHAMESLLRGRAEPHVWAVTPEKQQPPDEFRSVIATAECLLLCVPTVAHGPILDVIAGLLPSQASVLTIAKGLDEAGRTAAEILEGHCAARCPWGVLGGPMIADEIAAGRPAFAELGSPDKELFQRCVTLFPDRLRLGYTPDPMAVSWCGVLKNIYAPLIGLADELGCGDNTRGHLTAVALVEMQNLLRKFMGRAGGVYGDAGLADFVTTVTSASSHHYALGRRVARGDVSRMECEGTHSLKVLQARGISIPPYCPLFRISMGLVTGPADVAAALQRWLRAQD